MDDIQSNCKICYLPILTIGPDYVHNKNCGCDFHFTCFEKNNPNYFSITFPSCNYCKKLYKKTDLKHYDDVIYEHAFNLWIGKPKKDFLCKVSQCFQPAKAMYLNYCEKHFNETDEKNRLNKIFTECMGLTADQKYEIFKG